MRQSVLNILQMNLLWIGQHKGEQIMTTNFSFWVNCPFKVAISARSVKYNSITEIGCKNRSAALCLAASNCNQYKKAIFVPHG